MTPNYDSQWASINAVAQKLGVGTAETVRKWVRQATNAFSSFAINSPCASAIFTMRSFKPAATAFPAKFAHRSRSFASSSASPRIVSPVR